MQSSGWCALVRTMVCENVGLRDKPSYKTIGGCSFTVCLGGNFVLTKVSLGLIGVRLPI